jgi:hypothetical protein
MRQIAEIAHVPLEHRVILYFALANHMIDFTREHYIIRDPNTLQKANEMVEEWRERISDVGKARSLLATAIPELKSAIGKFEDIYGETDRIGLVAPHPIDRLLNEIQDWLNRPPPGIIKLAEARRGRGRPSRPTHAHFHDFVCTLLVWVNAVGGKLAFDKNYPARGTLVQALTLLRPHMPQGFIPEVLPARLLLGAQKIAKGGVEALEATLIGRKPPTWEIAEKRFNRMIRNEK